MEKLSLYHYGFCPYCRDVRRVIDQLNAPVELRDILMEPTHRDALVKARGRATVPVLRIEADHEDLWMPESVEIIEYLRKNYE